jgi:hypothetical protein
MSAARPLRVDLHARAAQLGVDLESALGQLRALYREVDARNTRNTAALNLPCKSGCSACCEDAVLLTRLEFFGIWDHLQTHLDDVALQRVVDDGLALYRAHEALMNKLTVARDKTALLRGVHFRCPVLNAAGACQAYPMREVLGRLFGSSFNDDGGVYGCHLVGAHLADQLVTLVRARPMASHVHDLPMAETQHVMPYYVWELYQGDSTGEMPPP